MHTNEGSPVPCDETEVCYLTWGPADPPPEHAFAWSVYIGINNVGWEFTRDALYGPGHGIDDSDIHDLYWAVSHISGTVNEMKQREASNATHTSNKG